MAKKTKSAGRGPSIVARVIAQMERESGRLVVPDVLVKAARNKNHPLHHRFPWDDAVAAHKHRLDIAQKLIASVRVVITVNKMKVTTQGYVHDPALGPHTSGYVSVARLRTERENAEEAILYEVNQVVAHLERTREIAFALDMSAEFEAAWDAAQQLQARARKGAAKGRAEVRVGA